MFFEQLFVNPRLLIKTPRKGSRHQLYEIFIALVVFAQQYKVIICRLPPCRAAFHIALCHINLAADYGLYTLSLTFLIKINNTVHNAVVGQGHSALSEVFNRANKLSYTAGAVKKAVFAMQMKMNKFSHFSSLFSDFFASISPAICIIFSRR